MSKLQKNTHEKLVHDLRNSLAPILMQAQLLSKYAESGNANADSIKNSASVIEQSAKEMAALLQGYLVRLSVE